VRATGGDAPELVVAFLSELVRLEDTDRFVARRVTAVVAKEMDSLRAELHGEPWDAARHVRRKEVKAVTFHRLHVSRKPPRARVILDI